MAYKLMVIDDARDRREKHYRKVFSGTEFEILYIWTKRDLEQYRDTPVDGYVLDVFLDKGDWASTNAADLLRNVIQYAPRPAPVFLVSQLWGDERILSILKQAGESSAKVVQYLAWSEFQQAALDSDIVELVDAARARMDALRNKLLFELDRWHGRSGFRPNPNDIIRILLLADVQFGDPDTDPSAPFAEHLIARALRKDGAIPDLIAIAGDVSHSGRPDQFALAEERFALDLIGQLWGSNNVDNYRDRIVLVPGNHDVNLRFSACDKRKFSVKNKTFEDDVTPMAWNSKTFYPYLYHHDYAMEPFRRFARRLTKDRNWEDSPNLSWVDRRFLHCGLRFFVLNSVGKLDAENPDIACLNEDTLREISRSLGDDDPEAIFSIALSHHGLRPEGAPDSEKAINDWHSVACDFFSMHRIRIWLYGHYHKFNARALNSAPFDNAPLWLLQAPTSRIGETTRGFCVLELHRQDGKVADAIVKHYVLENNAVELRKSRRVFDKG